MRAWGAFLDINTWRFGVVVTGSITVSIADSNVKL